MLNRLIWHHTGGTHAVNALVRKHYHFAIDGSGELHAGIHPPEANAPGRLRSGAYAGHTRNLNSGSIGLSVCGMGGADWSDPFGSTRWPIRPAQVDALIVHSARLCVQYGITPHRRHTLSHAEVQPTLGVTQSGKWDFDYSPRGAPGRRDPVAIGDELRAELVRAIAALRMAPATPLPSPRPVLRQGDSGPAVRDLQALLRIPVDGAFGPRTAAAVRAFQTRNQLLPDGIVGPMTWAALAPPA